MSRPRKTPVPREPPEFPMLIASKVRVRFEHAMLDVRLRLRVKLKPHYKGSLLRPVHSDDDEAIAWIRGRAARHGVLSWGRSGDGINAKFGWTKLLPQKRMSV